MHSKGESGVKVTHTQYEHKIQSWSRYLGRSPQLI